MSSMKKVIPGLIVVFCVVFAFGPLFSEETKVKQDPLRISSMEKMNAEISALKKTVAQLEKTIAQLKAEIAKDETNAAIEAENAAEPDAVVYKFSDLEDMLAQAETDAANLQNLVWIHRKIKDDYSLGLPEGSEDGLRFINSALSNLANFENALSSLETNVYVRFTKKNHERLKFLNILDRWLRDPSLVDRDNPQMNHIYEDFFRK